MTGPLLALAAVITAHTAAVLYRAWQVRLWRAELERAHWDRLRALCGDLG